MHVTIENFGPIRRVDFDLSKDLSVIFGKNNVGKSYTITAVYLLLKVLRQELGDHPSDLYKSALLQTARQPDATSGVSPAQAVGKALRDRFEHDRTARDLPATDALTTLATRTLAALGGPLTEAFASSFAGVAGLSNWTQNESLGLTLHTAALSLTFRAADDQLILAEVHLHRPVRARLVKNNRPATGAANGDLILYFEEGVADPTRDADAVWPALWMVTGFFHAELRAHAHAIYYLPASRSGLYPTFSALGALLAELSKSRHLLKSPITLPSLTQPVADYFLHLAGLHTTASANPVFGVGVALEQELLGGEINVNPQTKQLTFRQQGQPALDVAFSSSMVSELAPVVAFLKYLLPHTAPTTVEATEATEAAGAAPAHTLLFIEEPEAHLHPEVQVKLLTLFARLTRHHVKVVMTSHSNYMFNQLSNLLLTGELAPERVGSYLMEATALGSVINPVMQAGREGIADENFADVAEQLYAERLRAYDQYAHPAA